MLYAAPHVASAATANARTPGLHRCTPRSAHNGRISSQRFRIGPRILPAVPTPAPRLPYAHVGIRDAGGQPQPRRLDNGSAASACAPRQIELHVRIVQRLIQ
jgi:hypothetical protein